MCFLVRTLAPLGSIVPWLIDPAQSGPERS
jgi:hypothetical protein